MINAPKIVVWGNYVNGHVLKNRVAYSYFFGGAGAEKKNHNCFRGFLESNKQLD